jgi:sucrose-phosphate synthase
MWPSLPPAESEIVREVLELQDRFDLYGQLALPKRHTTWEVPEIYRLAARHRGVFVNVALTEPFGLTLLEAAASGLPVVATDQGGPTEIVARLENGVVVDAQDTTAISDAIFGVLTDQVSWRTRSERGIKNLPRHYLWGAHAEHFMELVWSTLRRSGTDGVAEGAS